MATLKEEAGRFKPVDIEKLSEDDNITEAMRQACRLYNSSLRELVGGGNASVARNNLRKATVLFPEFDRAVVLYGICLFFNGDRTGAMRTFISVKSPGERSKAMKLYDRLVDDELSADGMELKGARLRKADGGYEDEIDKVYTKKGEDIGEFVVTTQPRSLFIDGDAGMESARSVKISTTGWSRSGNSANGPSEASRKKATVTLTQIPEIEEQQKREDRTTFFKAVSAALAIICLILLIVCLALAGRSKKLKRQLEKYENGGQTGYFETVFEEV